MDRYVRFARPDGTTGAGLLEGDRIAAIAEPFWERAQRIGEELATDAVRLLPPCQPRSIVCVGLNYASHLGGRPAPDPPTLFFKPLSAIAGPGDPIRLPAASARVEPEGEIVIVIGRELASPTREEALAGVFGYTAGNDVSARDWQASDGQWWRAKGADTFAVFGPAIATGLAHDAIEVRTRVNGVETQRGRSDELILDVPAIVHYVASVMTLLPGDIIYSGTPGQPRPLRPGDAVEIEVTAAGTLRNPVVDDS